VLLRAARELLDANVPARRVRAALEALREQLPVGRPLSAVHISALGDRVFVRDADHVWEPDSGQIQIDFAVAEVAKRAEPIARRAVAEPDETDSMTADEWYDTGLDLEAVSREGAELAYRRALGMEPGHPDAHLNLGRLLHEGGRLEEAEGHYRAAVAADPQSARAHYNLGVALEDLGRIDEAMDAYGDALRLDETLATAHFNLSRLLEARGDEAEALGHLLAYKRLLERGERNA
jgi:tetratricopeptide (TPR) repeat protein